MLFALYLSLVVQFSMTVRRLFYGSFSIIPHLFSLVNTFFKLFLKVFSVFSRLFAVCPRSRESFNILPLIRRFVNSFFKKNEICKLLTFSVVSKVVFLSKR